MYSVTPGAERAWKDLFEWLARTSGVDLVSIDHAFPMRLSDLWAREDLAAGFMCGFPFACSEIPPVPVAAPVPDRGPGAGAAAYATHLIVAAASPFQSLEETFGGRVGYTVEDSQSGYNALRHHFFAYRRDKGTLLYGKSLGGLFTPRRVIEALLDGMIDVGPLDSYAYELIARHEPELSNRIRTVATTEPTPIPFLVASRTMPLAVVEALRSALLQFGDAPDTIDLRDRLCLSGFAPVDLAGYAVYSEGAAAADAAGYGAPF
jgi:ABC-type phosphate/phosphonate transport system substrate-binding protein